MNQILKEKIIDYYTKYYRDDCSLVDYRTRTNNRLNEEENEFNKIQDLGKILDYDFYNKKQFIFGAGTGGLAVVLKEKFNSDVFGIEPHTEAFEIIKLKCKDYSIPLENFKNEYGENISFNDSQFDFVHCYTVLEHVNDVEKSLDEMIRLVKPGGLIYINTPNYSYPYEGHYKMAFPTFLPRFFGHLFLLILGKNPNFLKTINYITEKDINKILAKKKNNIIWFRIYKPLKKNRASLSVIWNYLLFKLFIYPNQEIIIRKII